MSQPIILVASATANTGSKVVEQLSASGKVAVRGLTRNPHSATAQALAKLPNVTVVKGDFDDSASLKAALQGVSRAFLVGAPGDDKQYDQEVAFLSAAAEAGLEAVVRVSTCNLLIDENAAGVYARAHGRIEKWIEQHNAKVVDLQPNFFLSNMLWQAGEAKATGKITYPLSQEQAASMPPTAFIDPRDVAGAGVAALLSTKDQMAKLLEARRVEVHGPEAMTFAQLLEAISKVAGKTVTFNHMPPEEWGKFLNAAGTPLALAEGFRDTVLEVAGLQPSPRPACNETTPALAAIWQPKFTVEQWAKEFGAAFA